MRKAPIASANISRLLEVIRSRTVSCNIASFHQSRTCRFMLPRKGISFL